MIREFGSPTLFLTLSCAEYESPEIISYLRKVNTVPSSYDMGKFCTEDPISVSRKFLIKFQAFFSEIVKNGEVLGIVDHFPGRRSTRHEGPHTSTSCCGSVMPQSHKCSAYCKRRGKLGSTFVTRCRFQFPRQACEAASLNSVEDSLKSRKKVYNLPCTEEERVNDYSPLLLLLWKPTWTSSTAEASLAIAHYVSSYVTKAEKSNIQEL